MKSENTKTRTWDWFGKKVVLKRMKVDQRDAPWKGYYWQGGFPGVTLTLHYCTDTKLWEAHVVLHFKWFSPEGERPFVEEVQLGAAQRDYVDDYVLAAKTAERAKELVMKKVRALADLASKTVQSGE